MDDDEQEAAGGPGPEMSPSSGAAAAAMSRARRHTSHFVDSAPPAPQQRAEAALSSYERVHGRGSRAPATWQAAPISGLPLQDVVYEKARGEGIAKITINRPERRNAFRPETIRELQRAFDAVRDDAEVSTEGGGVRWLARRIQRAQRVAARWWCLSSGWGRLDWRISRSCGCRCDDTAGLGSA